MGWSHFPVTAGTSTLGPFSEPGCNELIAAARERRFDIPLLAAGDPRWPYTDYVRAIQVAIDNAVSTTINLGPWVILPKDANHLPKLTDIGGFDGETSIPFYTPGTFAADLSVLMQDLTGDGTYTIPTVASGIGWYRELDDGSHDHGQVVRYDRCFPDNTLNELYCAMRLLVGRMSRFGYGTTLQYDGNAVLHDVTSGNQNAPYTSLQDAHDAADGRWPLATTTGLGGPTMFSAEITVQNPNPPPDWYYSWLFRAITALNGSVSAPVSYKADGYIIPQARGAWHHQYNLSEANANRNYATYLTENVINYIDPTEVSVAANAARAGTTKIGAGQFDVKPDWKECGWQLDANRNNSWVVSRYTGLDYK